jgi:hypothetical protein
VERGRGRDENLSTVSAAPSDGGRASPTKREDGAVLPTRSEIGDAPRAVRNAIGLKEEGRARRKSGDTEDGGKVSVAAAYMPA